MQATAEGAELTTDYYTVLVKPTPPPPTCEAPASSTDVKAAKRSAKYPLGFSASDRAACCAACEGDETCVAWVHEPSANGANCWPLADFGSATSAAGREVGCSAARFAACQSRISKPAFTVRSTGGRLLYDSDAPTATPSNLLNWPSPTAANAYAVVDYPRFFVPDWGVSPAPAGSAHAATNGYDFTNNVEGDTYIFLLGDLLQDSAVLFLPFLSYTRLHTPYRNYSLAHCTLRRRVYLLTLLTILTRIGTRRAKSSSGWWRPTLCSPTLRTALGSSGGTRTLRQRRERTFRGGSRWEKASRTKHTPPTPSAGGEGPPSHIRHIPPVRGSPPPLFHRARSPSTCGRWI